MSCEDDAHRKQQNFQVNIRIMNKSWQTIKTNVDIYREEIAHEFFQQNPQRHRLFEYPNPNARQHTTEDAIKRKLLKHSSSVINCMETIVDFVNGNEESKPMYFLLGRQHKLAGVNEKMFLEMKEAICKVIRLRLKEKTSNAWEIILDYIYINYVFPGMQMIQMI